MLTTRTAGYQSSPRNARLCPLKYNDNNVIADLTNAGGR